MQNTAEGDHDRCSSGDDHDPGNPVLASPSGEAVFLRPVTLGELMSAAWPYLLGGVAVVGSGLLVYHFATKED